MPPQDRKLKLIRITQIMDRQLRQRRIAIINLQGIKIITILLQLCSSRTRLLHRVDRCLQIRYHTLVPGERRHKIIPQLEDFKARPWELIMALQLATHLLEITTQLLIRIINHNRILELPRQDIHPLQRHNPIILHNRCPAMPIKRQGRAVMDLRLLSRLHTHLQTRTIPILKMAAHNRPIPIYRLNLTRPPDNLPIIPLPVSPRFRTLRPNLAVLLLQIINPPFHKRPIIPHPARLKAMLLQPHNLIHHRVALILPSGMELTHSQIIRRHNMEMHLINTLDLQLLNRRRRAVTVGITTNPTLRNNSLINYLIVLILNLFIVMVASTVLQYLTVWNYQFEVNH